MKEVGDDAPPLSKRLSSNIRREPDTIGSEFRLIHTYRFTCPQYLEAVDNFEDFGIPHNEVKERLVEQLVEGFRHELNLVVFGDPAGRSWVEHKD